MRISRNGPLLATALSLCPPSMAAQDVLHDNGLPDGSGGHSNATVNVFGARRTVLDDFALPDGELWRVTEFQWRHTWSTAPPGSGTGAELCFREDNAGTPGPVLLDAVVTLYSEAATGTIYFSRPEVLSCAVLEPIYLDPDKYWFEGTIVGPDNNFWLIHLNVTCTEHWVNYDDFSGLQSSVDMFGGPSDLNFVIKGGNAIGTNYCDANANSTGVEAGIRAFGSEVAADNDIELVAKDLPANEFGYFLNSPSQGFVANPGGSAGNLCLGAGIGRHIDSLKDSGPGGSITLQLDLTALPRPSGGPHGVMSGETWSFQCWYRDGMSSNFTDGVSITFQ